MRIFRVIWHRLPGEFHSKRRGASFGSAAPLIGLLLAGLVNGAELPSIDGKIETGIKEYTELSRERPVDKSVTSLDPHKDKSTTDHSKLKELQGPFKSGPEVTKACLGCHNKAGDQFIHNKHWTWSYTNPRPASTWARAYW